MTVHLTDEQQLGFLRGDLRREDVFAVRNHLAQCSRCADAAATNEHAARAGVELIERFDEDEEHPPVETTLTAYVDGTLAANEAATVQLHLKRCAVCRTDVEDLRSMAATLAAAPPAHARRWFPAAAAAAAAIVIVSAAMWLRNPPTMTAVPERTPARIRVVPTPTATPTREPAPYARAEWRDAMNDALRTRSLVMPRALAELRLEEETQRAPSASSEVDLSPIAVVLETTRPRFEWTASNNATYVVTVLDGQNVIAESPTLHESHWQPARDLPRGRVYEWQVEVQGPEPTVIPAAPAPPALFRILDARAHAELDEARNAHPADALLLGVLYARHGLRDEAERELRRVDTADGRALLDSVRRWAQ